MDQNIPTSWNGYIRNTPPRNSHSPSQRDPHSSPQSHHTNPGVPLPMFSPLIPAIHRFHCTIVRLRKKNHSTHHITSHHITHHTHTHTAHTSHTHHKNGNTRKRKGKGNGKWERDRKPCISASDRIGFGFFVFSKLG
jgi:hypothetical protein